MARERSKGADVVVVGAGAIGLAAAAALARAGRGVVVLDPRAPGAAATTAAGGMLSPLAEARGAGPFLELGLDSLALWPAFAEGLTERTGVALDLRLDGKLLVALDDADVERLRVRQAWLTAAGHDARWLEGADLARREPAVDRAARAGLHVARDGQVDNRALARALTAVAEAEGCTLRRTDARALLVRGGRVRGVRTGDGDELACAAVVLAAGAWSGTIEGLPRAVPVRPVKGQMIALAGDGAPLRTMVESEACYLIPRAGAAPSVWVGATSEHVGFARGTTDEARAALRRAAAHAVPALGAARELEAWDGFRPATPDGLPILGRDPDVEGLVYATGHFRNGILLAPVTAELTLRAVEERADPRLAAFGIGRFATG